MVPPGAVERIVEALGGRARHRYCVVAERNGLRVCWEIANSNMTLIDVTLDPQYPIALRVVDGQIVGAEPAVIMKFLLDDEFHKLVQSYPLAQIGTTTATDGRELLRLSREGNHAELHFVVDTIDALVRVASRIEEAYHLAHAGPYR